MLILNKNRVDLAKLFTGIGAEIGVEQGIYSEIICEQSFNVKLFCIDSWAAYKAYVDHKRKSKLDLYYFRTKRRLSPYNCIIMRKSSMEALKFFEDCSLDFVYIDANHAYKFVMEDITEWAKKVKPGGIVAGHDYLDKPERGEYYKVKDAVNDYVKANAILDLTIYNADEFPSWSFTKC